MRRCLIALAALFFTTPPAQADLNAAQCNLDPVVVTRVLGEKRVEEAELRLTDCFGQPRRRALIELSLLARPHGVPRPRKINRTAKKLIADSVRRLDPRLLTRLQALATRWPGHRIEIVSGYRPNAKSTSRHRHGRALDLRVVGVDKEEVVAFAKAIPGTGVGYYPNSVFTHVDVRDESTTWVDHSGPGQRAKYGRFPEDFVATLDDPEASKRAAREALETLQTNGLQAATSKPATSVPTPVIAAPVAISPARLPSIEAEIDNIAAANPTKMVATPAVEETAIAASRPDRNKAVGTDTGYDTSRETFGADALQSLTDELTTKLGALDAGLAGVVDTDSDSEISSTRNARASRTPAQSADMANKPRRIDWSPPWE